MALIARIQHPYIVEFKEAWVEKVRTIVCILDYMIKICSVFIYFFPELESPCFVIM